MLCRHVLGVQLVLVLLIVASLLQNDSLGGDRKSQPRTKYALQLLTQGLSLVLVKERLASSS